MLAIGGRKVKMSFRESIKFRLVKSFMIIIILTVLTLELVLIQASKVYLYRNLSDMLKNQIEISMGYFLRYNPTENIEDMVLDDIELFWQHTTAQVQIIDRDGNLLMDSIGVESLKQITPDIKKAIGGKEGSWVGNVDYFPRKVMAVSVPILKGDEPIVVVRFISSLDKTNELIINLIVVLTSLGLIVLLISGLVSLFLANSIIKPLQEVTDVAEKMAGGELSIRTCVEKQDEIGKLSETLNFMASEIQKKDNIKNEFISSISHELRTPLTSIKGWALTLLDENLESSDLLYDGLEIIEKESRRLETMVEELLDFSKFVSNRISLDLKKFDLNATLVSVYRQMLPRSKSLEIDLEVKVLEEEIIIRGDENRIKQVLINLIDNSLKFTNRGGRVLVSSEKKDSKVYILIEDTGIGIDPEDMPRVTEMFYKGKASKSNSGIGLSIANEIIELHGASLKLDSVLGQGTKAWIIFPLEVE